MCLFHRVLLQTALLRLRSIESVVIVKRVVHNECKCKRISRKNKCLYDFFVGLVQNYIQSYDAQFYKTHCFYALIFCVNFHMHITAEL